MQSATDYYDSLPSCPVMDMSYDPGKGYDALSELMRAIILTAIRDLNSTEELREDALEFLFSEEEDHIFSFRSICSCFGVDADRVRQRILGGDRIRTRRRHV